ncbi:CopL family metal-binding regulatory protein [Lysobacter sp. KIS68-7]|uniref:CopL family metal-binding regulatory protein n=1 Tax=Lysobacter sp. KIS68-7 TaxID=2904252 RepID=UPI001E5C07E0|nr:CopL family metal-binding regulatory protein [Lysobacter sp. KIS68-7]UHQ18869.1 CopL family metal-binding regulatory protein [Lysobacter sp. KIS68-7]
MRTCLPLLRLLLCASLVLNGVASAFAGASTHVATQATAATQAAGCHEDAMAAPTHERAPAPAHDGDSCCTDVTCLSHCLGTGYVAAPAMTLSAQLASVAPALPAPAQHRAPAPTNLLRPPIG